jgi:hypothetical protein
VRSRSQHKRKRERACRLRGSGNPFDSQPNIVKGTRRVPSRILDRASNEPDLCRQADCFRHNFWRVAKPLSQVRRDGQIGRIHQSDAWAPMPHFASTRDLFDPGRRPRHRSM